MLMPIDKDPRELVELAKEFLQVISAPAKEIGELLADEVRSFRFSNQIRILNKARTKLRESGISAGKVPFRLLVPLLDSGSLEEEEAMLDRWANLLANAANPNRSGDIKLAYVEVLKQLSPIDAVVLDKLYDYYRNELSGRQQDILRQSYTIQTLPIEIDGAHLRGMVGITREEFERAMDNLWRLNLVTTSGALLVNPQLHEEFYSQPANVSLQFTRFGYGFVSACKTTT